MSNLSAVNHDCALCVGGIARLVCKQAGAADMIEFCETEKMVLIDVASRSPAASMLLHEPKALQ